MGDLLGVLPWAAMAAWALWEGVRYRMPGVLVSLAVGLACLLVLK